MECSSEVADSESTLSHLLLGGSSLLGLGDSLLSSLLGLGSSFLCSLSLGGSSLPAWPRDLHLLGLHDLGLHDFSLLDLLSLLCDRGDLVRSLDLDQGLGLDGVLQGDVDARRGGLVTNELLDGLAGHTLG